MMTDFIGDVHGHANKLKELLGKLGYSKANGSFRHPERKIVFVGDYIDRGPQIPETLKIVRGMVDDGSAVALLGNHEYNAICFHVEAKSGGHLRRHLIKNILQHHQTLHQFQNRQREYEEYIAWFKELPLYYETDAYRVVHACWDMNNVEFLRSRLEDDCLNDDLIHEAAKPDSALYKAIEDTLKGKEIEMPNGQTFTDKDGHLRKEIRIKWWEDPQDTSYRSLSVEPIESLPTTPVPSTHLKGTKYYSLNDKPVFFGHYWLRGKPMLYRSNICCLDYSVAKEGYLAAYRFDGESALQESKLEYV